MDLVVSKASVFKFLHVNWIDGREGKGEERRFAVGAGRKDKVYLPTSHSHMTIQTTDCTL